jgi:subtilisin family serine protease
MKNHMKASFRPVLFVLVVLALGAGVWAAGRAATGERFTGTFSPPTAEATSSVIVGFESNKEAQAVSSVLRMGATDLDPSASGDFVVVDVPAGTDVASFVDELSSRPGVEYVEPDTVVYAAMASNDTYYPMQWGMGKVGAPLAWDITRGAGVTVAVIDTGVDLGHPDLAGRVDTANDYDFANDDATAQDDHGHGTHVAGIIGATLNNRLGVAGVANQCTILPVKVLSASGSGYSSDVADGIRWAADHGAKVINLSLGGDSYSSTMNAAVQYAVGKDCVVVAASGNSGQNGVIYPAGFDNVIGVGATGSGDALASFSNYGSKVDVTAPGVSVYSSLLGGTYGSMSGTSMASPHAAGVVALIRAKNPTWSRDQAEYQLIATAQDLGTAGRDDYFGYGRVRANDAAGTSVPVGSRAPSQGGATELSIPTVSSARPLHGRTASFTSRLTPAAGATAGTAKLYLYRWEHKTVRVKVGGTWKRVRVGYWRLRSTRTMSARSDGRLVASYRLPYAGKWKAFARYSGGPGFAPSVSGTKRFSAR